MMTDPLKQPIKPRHEQILIMSKPRVLLVYSLLNILSVLSPIKVVLETRNERRDIRRIFGEEIRCLFECALLD